MQPVFAYRTAKMLAKPCRRSIWRQHLSEKCWQTGGWQPWQ